MDKWPISSPWSSADKHKYYAVRYCTVRDRAMDFVIHSPIRIFAKTGENTEHTSLCYWNSKDIILQFFDFNNEKISIKVPIMNLTKKSKHYDCKS